MLKFKILIVSLSAENCIYSISCQLVTEIFNIILFFWDFYIYLWSCTYINEFTMFKLFLSDWLWYQDWILSSLGLLFRTLYYFLLLLIECNFTNSDYNVTKQNFIILNPLCWLFADHVIIFRRSYHELNTIFVWHFLNAIVLKFFFFNFNQFINKIC